MEHLRTRAGATGRNRDGPDNGSNKPIRNGWQPTAAVSAHVKEGVNGSSPLEQERNRRERPRDTKCLRESTA